MLADNDAGEPQLGDPTDVTLRFDGAWRGPKGTIEIPELHATVGGAALSGSLALRDLDTDAAIDLALGVQRLDFAQLLGTSGLAVPESLVTCRATATTALDRGRHRAKPVLWQYVHASGIPLSRAPTRRMLDRVRPAI